MDRRCQAEVVELHRFFEDWISGRLERTAAAFERFSGVMADGFEIIEPGGRRRDLDQLRDSLWSGHGARRDTPLRIDVRDVRCQQLGHGLARVTYEEWQSVAGEVDGRISTALMRDRAGTPNGVEWVAVHETALPSDAERT